jgi:hypothetical protein
MFFLNVLNVPDMYLIKSKRILEVPLCNNRHSSCLNSQFEICNHLLTYVFKLEDLIA